MSNTYNYLLSNDSHKDDYGIYEPTWIMFVESTAASNKDDVNDVLIEVYKYIEGSMGTQSTTRRVVVEEARAEWNFWLGQGVNRITDPENKGWEYTRHLQQRAALNLMFENSKNN